MPSDTRPRLLFVDDEARILRTLDMVFRHDYQVLGTTDGREALELLRRHTVDVIVSDQRMPLMSGVEVLRGARDVSPDTLRLLLTGYADLASIVGSINDGEIFRYIQKPWHIRELRETVDEAVRIARQTRQPVGSVEPMTEGQGVVVLYPKPSMARFLRGERPDLPIHGANNMEQALALLERYPKAMLLTELILPEGDISDALALLKLRRPELVVVVVTSFSDTSYLIRLINRAQVYRVLPMPVGRKVLLGSLDSALLHQRRLSATPLVAQRHKVALTSEDAVPESGIVRRVRGYLDRLRA